MVDSTHQERYEKTLRFVQKYLAPSNSVLDLGTPNPLSKMMKEKGLDVKNTNGEDLDVSYQNYIQMDVDAVTSFEVFEHMLAPFNILKNLQTKKLIASVPLKLWFASAYWNVNDDWDKHYHEFEKKQFDFLLNRTGWKIKDHQIWAPKTLRKIGVRPILRLFTPRYYLVYCER